MLFSKKIDDFITSNQDNIIFTHNKFEFIRRKSLNEANILIYRKEKNNNNNSFPLSLQISKFSRIIEFEKGNK